MTMKMKYVHMHTAWKRSFFKPFHTTFSPELLKQGMHGEHMFGELCNDNDNEISYSSAFVVEWIVM